MSLKVEKHHSHAQECDIFQSALTFGHIVVIEGEPQITGKLPEGTKAGNIITGVEYDPNDFILNMTIHFCPFCGKDLRIEGVASEKKPEQYIR